MFFPHGVTAGVARAHGPPFAQVASIRFGRALFGIGEPPNGGDQPFEINGLGAEFVATPSSSASRILSV